MQHNHRTKLLLCVRSAEGPNHIGSIVHNFPLHTIETYASTVFILPEVPMIAVWKIINLPLQAFLNRIVSDHGSIDLEWLRDVPPDKAK